MLATEMFVDANWVSVLTIGATCSCALGQGAILSWQFRATDDGPWEPSGVVLIEPHALVRARCLISWTPEGPNEFFSATRFDAFVRRDGNYGSADAIQNVVIRRPGSLNLVENEFLGVFSMPQMLKIDDLRDSLPPGEGAYGVYVGQSPELMNQRYHNPLSIMEFDYLLDGTFGTRTFDLVFLPPTLATPVAIYRQDWSQYRVEAVTIPGMVHVVPGPGVGAGVVVGAGIWVVRRRRMAFEAQR